MTHVVIAVDELDDRQVARIKAALEGWATLERVGDDAPAERVGQADVVFGWPAPELLLASRIQLVQLPSVGYDGYTGKGLGQKKGLTICNASGVMGPGIAEHVLAMMLALARRLPEHLRDQQARRWRKLPEYGELAGATACVVGLGDLGTAIARRCAAFDMRVIGVRRDAASGHSVAEQVFSIDQLHQAVAAADHVIAILPAAPNTARLFDRAVFGAMKRGACFYNIGRGSTVDEHALIEQLESGGLAGAGLDVFEREPLPDDSPLWTMDNVIVTPHVGGRGAGEFERHADLLIDNLRRFRAGEPLRNVVTL